VVKVVLWSRRGAHPTKPGWSKPDTHSNPTNLALFRHKITLYRFNQGAHTIAGGSNGSRGLSPASPPHFNHCCQLTSSSSFATVISCDVDIVTATYRCWLQWCCYTAGCSRTRRREVSARWTASISTRGSSSRRSWPSVRAPFSSSSCCRCGSSSAGSFEPAKGRFSFPSVATSWLELSRSRA